MLIIDTIRYYQLIYCNFVCSGVDVLAVLESLGLSEQLLKPLRESSAGYVALTFALYKLLTPLRYAVTIGKNNDIRLLSYSMEILNIFLIFRWNYLCNQKVYCYGLD